MPSEIPEISLADLRNQAFIVIQSQPDQHLLRKGCTINTDPLKKHLTISTSRATKRALKGLIDSPLLPDWSFKIITA